MALAGPPLAFPDDELMVFFPGIHPAVPFSVQGLVLGAPEACSQSPSQPSRGLLPCTAQQPQPQPPQQPPPQPQGLPPAAQQQPAMSNHVLSQVSGCAGRGARSDPRAPAGRWKQSRGALDSRLPSGCWVSSCRLPIRERQDLCAVGRGQEKVGGLAKPEYDAVTPQRAACSASAPASSPPGEGSVAPHRVSGMCSGTSYPPGEGPSQTAAGFGLPSAEIPWLVTWCSGERHTRTCAWLCSPDPPRVKAK